LNIFKVLNGADLRHVLFIGLAHEVVDVLQMGAKDNKIHLLDAS
jgi:hypothetical protein